MANVIMKHFANVLWLVVLAWFNLIDFSIDWRFVVLSLLCRHGQHWNPLCSWDVKSRSFAEANLASSTCVKSGSFSHSSYEGNLGLIEVILSRFEGSGWLQLCDRESLSIHLHRWPSILHLRCLHERRPICEKVRNVYLASLLLSVIFKLLWLFLKVCHSFIKWVSRSVFDRHSLRCLLLLLYRYIRMVLW